MSQYKHLSIEEREKLYLLHGQGKSFRYIAKELGRAPSTISREYQRGRCWRHPYLPSRAQIRYMKRRKKCGRKRILSQPEYKEKIRHYIANLRWSPEQISNRLKMENSAFQISYTSIYRAIWNGVLDTSTIRISHRKAADRFIKKLRYKGKKRKTGNQRPGKFEILHTIGELPDECVSRATLGHWEVDTVLGTKGGARLLTMVDRKSRYTIASKVASGKAADVSMEMQRLLSLLPPEKAKSIISDRGHEFADYQDVMKEYPDLTFYFAHPYSPWERGTNENTNGLIREFAPKSKPIELLTTAHLCNEINLLNHRPRKCLNWRTPSELYWGNVLHLT